MRCSCHECGTYMVHSESSELGCVCPECGARCKMCLGTNTVVSREDLRARAIGYLAMRSQTDETREIPDEDKYDERQYRD
ncbi:MAG: hypothetical protein IIW08_06240 [Clostridia bacterium]|nr:hypothetical protein [Clostridia bacterium]